MGWWGKIFGGAFGFLLGGPLGAILGAALGHNFDRGLRGEGESPLGASQERTQTAFFTATFSVMGHLCKADGRVSENEIAQARAIMAQMDLTPEQRRLAMELFNRGKAPGFPIRQVLDQLRQEVRQRRSLLRVFLEIQLAAALADGDLHPAERKLLLDACDTLHIPRAEYARLEAMAKAARQAGARQGAPAQPSLEQAYAILSLGRGASDEEVKRSYRRLVSQHHPDKLVAKGLPEEMMRVATQKTQELRQAYERIREARGF